MAMEYRLFGRTGVHVSPLTLGCMLFGGRTNPTDSYAIISRALDAGINILDTASVYNQGGSEEVVGEALKRFGQRQRVFLTTKFHGNTDPNMQGTSRRYIIQQCEASLRRFQTEYIDLYQHRPFPETAADETLRALDDLVRTGKVRYLGTSTFGAWQVVEALWAAKELGLNRYVSEQPPYNLLDRCIERELLPMCRTFGLAVIPWAPLGGGLLTGKYRRHEALPEGSRFAGEAGSGSPQLRRLRDEVFAVTQGLQPLAEEKGCTLSQLALAWAVQQPGITSPIIGPRTMEQLEDNLKALEVQITDEDRRRIDAIAPPGAMLSPFYEANFGPHPHRVL